MGRKNHKWTDEECLLIRCDYRHTMASKQELADRLGVSMQGVAGQIARMGIAKRKDYQCWTPDQDEKLSQLITQYSPPLVARRMHRSVNSVIVRAKRLGLSRRARDGWYTKRDVCEILGVDHHKVQKWIDAGELKASYHTGNKPQQHGGACWHILKEDLRAFIIKHCIELNGRNVDLFDFTEILVGG